MNIFKLFSRLMAVFGLVLIFAVSGWADTYDTYPINLTSAGYSNASLVVKNNAIDEFSITLQSAGTFSASVSGNSTVKFNVSTSAMPDKSTHSLTSYGPVSYPSGQVLYLSSSAPGQTSDQTYTLNLTLSGATLHEGSRPFTIRNPSNTRNIVGNYFVGGNTNMCVTDSTTAFTGTCNNTTNKNNTYYTKYIDIDANTSTFNSSSFTLGIPSGSEVVWAGLYWQGYVHNSDQANDFRETMTLSGQTVSGSGKGLNLNVNSFDAEKVLFRTPQNSSYQTVVADQVDFDELGYAGYKDVTALINPTNPNGEYILANIQSHRGKESSHGNFAGWSLAVIYKNAAEKLNNVSVFDGYATVDSSYNSDINVSGFYTPTSGTISSKLTIFSMEGESDTGDSLRLEGTLLPVTGLNTDTGAQNNVFNGSITNIPTRNPAMTNNDGLDIDTFNTSSIITTNKSSAIIKMRTTGDRYTPSMLVFSTELYQPEVCYYEKVFQGVTLIGNGAEVNYGDTLRAEVYIKNKASETAQNVKIYRTFDSLLPYVSGTTHLDNNNPSYGGVYNLLQKTDNVDGDTFDYNISDKKFQIRIGTGATATSGGNLVANQGAAFDYNFTVNSEQNTSMSYQVAYTNTAINFDYVGQVVKCVDFNNTFYAPNVVIAAVGFDARETSIALADDNRSITTKITNKPISLNVVSLNTSGQLAPYTGIDNNRVYLFTVDTSVCSLPEVDRLAVINTKPRSTYVTFIQPNTNHIAPNFTETSAGKDKRIMMNFINWNQEFMDAAFNCSNSNTQAVLNGVPQCLNSDSKLAQVFPNLVTECLGGARPACQSTSYAAGGLPTAPYDNEFGCYQCLAGGAGAAVCSTDNFAIRPDRLDVNSSHAHYPNLLRSAEDYNTTINAYNYNTITNTADYNVTNANTTFSLVTKMFDRNNIERNSTTTPAMHGTSSFATNSFDMSNGRSVKSGFTGDVAGLMFDDVGKVGIHLEDRIWSAVDNDDTPQDCSINGTYVCGDKNVIFIPEHFDFNELNITNNNGNPGSFTYIANEFTQMGGRIHTQIRALNKDGNVTANFATFPLWENSMNVSPEVTSGIYLYPAANETMITNLELGFTAGLKTIPWNETNTSQYLRFNFQRDVNPSTPPSPFDVNGSDLNIVAASTYTDPEDGDNAFINGSRNGTADGSSRFVYGRIIPRDVRVFGANTPFTANGWYEAYNAPMIGTAPLPMSKNGVLWYTNTLHTDLSDGDGNVTLVVTGANPVNTNIVPGTGVEIYSFDNSYGLGGYKAHILTAPWLWYGINASAYANPGTDCLTHPCFNISVIPAIGATGSAKSTNESTKESKRSTKGTGWHSTTDYAPAIR